MKGSRLTLFPRFLVLCHLSCTSDVDRENTRLANESMGSSCLWDSNRSPFCWAWRPSLLVWPQQQPISLGPTALHKDLDNFLLPFWWLRKSARTRTREIRGKRKRCWNSIPTGVNPRDFMPSEIRLAQQEKNAAWRQGEHNLNSCELTETECRVMVTRGDGSRWEWTGRCWSKCRVPVRRGRLIVWHNDYS